MGALNPASWACILLTNQFTKEIQLLETRLNTAEERLSEANKELVKKGNDIRFLESTVEKLQNGIGENTEIFAALRSSVHEKEEKIGELQEELSQKTDQITVNQQQISEHVKNVEDKKSQIELLHLQFKKTTLEVELLADICASGAKLSVDKMWKSRSELEKICSKSKIYEIGNNILNLIKHKQEQESQIQKMQKELQENTPYIKDLDDLYSNLRFNLKTKEEKLHALESKNLYNDDKISYLERKIARHKDRIDESDNIIKSLKTELQSLQNQLSSASHVNDSLITEKYALKKEIRQYRWQVENLKKKPEVADHEVQTEPQNPDQELLDKVGNLEATNLQLSNDLLDAISAKEKLKSTLKRWNDHNNSKNLQILRLKEKLKNAQEDKIITDLKDKLTRMQIDLTVKNNLYENQVSEIQKLKQEIGACKLEKEKIKKHLENKLAQKVTALKAQSQQLSERERKILGLQEEITKLQNLAVMSAADVTRIENERDQLLKFAEKVQQRTKWKANKATPFTCQLEHLNEHLVNKLKCSLSRQRKRVQATHSLDHPPIRDLDKGNSGSQPQQAKTRIRTVKKKKTKKIVKCSRVTDRNSVETAADISANLASDSGFENDIEVNIKQKSSSQQIINMNCENCIVITATESCAKETSNSVVEKSPLVPPKEEDMDSENEMVDVEAL